LIADFGKLGVVGTSLNFELILKEIKKSAVSTFKL